MAMTNHERVGKALDLLKDGLRPFVEREMKAQHAHLWFEQVKASVRETPSNFFGTEDKPRWDVAALLAVMWNQWQLVFRKTLGQAERSLVSELREVRNKWAHQNPFSGDDAYRALDSASRLLTAVSASQADDVEKMKMELLRVRFDEQVRTEKRKSAGTAIESQATGGLTPWREVVNPHKDVASGRYQQAEFAADLWQVHIGEGSDEYKNPDEFFRRTYLTDSLKRLLAGAVRRLTGNGGDPVVQLQTNFGGGKTHSMLALYHLVSGTPPGDLLGVDAVMKEAGVSKLPAVKRVVLVGNRISPGNPAEAAAKAILESRGNSPRLFRNTLVFLAADQVRLQDLDEAVRRYLAWDAILTEKEMLNLDPHQVKQAENQLAAADDIVSARIPETYQWLLVPGQANPQASVEWQAFRLTGLDALAVRASKKLRNDELLITSLAGTRLRMELDRIPLWRGNHVSIKQLADDFARYLYLPRLADTRVLVEAISSGFALLTWDHETFAYADSYDESAHRYQGLRCGQHVPITTGDTGLLVRSEIARQQQEAEAKPIPSAQGQAGAGQRSGTTGGAAAAAKDGVAASKGPRAPKRFHGSVELDPTRVGRDAGRIADEIIAHLAGLVGSEVKVTLEIDAQIPNGAPDHVVRTVTENSRTLKFTSQGFEEE